MPSNEHPYYFVVSDIFQISNAGLTIISDSSLHNFSPADIVEIHRPDNTVCKLQIKGKSFSGDSISFGDIEKSQIPIGSKILLIEKHPLSFNKVKPSLWRQIIEKFRI